MYTMAAHRQGARGHLPSPGKCKMENVFHFNCNIFVCTKRTKIVATKHVSLAQNKCVCDSALLVSVAGFNRTASWKGKEGEEKGMGGKWKGEERRAGFCLPPRKNSLSMPSLCKLTLLILSAGHITHSVLAVCWIVCGAV